MIYRTYCMENCFWTKAETAAVLLVQSTVSLTVARQQETVTVGVDGTVLERISKIMAYLRLGGSGKVRKSRCKFCTLA